MVITRVLDAPRDRVWKAWTEPERLTQWWGPTGFTAPAARTDPRVGGTYLWGMRSPEGQEFYTTGVFREVVENERFVATEQFADADGRVVPASQHGLPGDWPEATVLAVTLEDRNGRTAMTVQEEGVPAEMAALSELGMRQTLDKLADYLETASAEERMAEAPTGPPDPRLRRLDPFVGTWSMQGKEADEYGEISGTLTFEWMEGGYFLLQHVDLDHAGRPVKGIEVIGYGRDWEGRAPRDCTSHFFDNDGNHFEYVYEVGDDGTVTIWGGYVGSPAAFRARMSEDGRTITGRWDWPGGGYDAVITRVG
jgi:uncharacterized protein YndB with AHSA1/START domain